MDTRARELVTIGDKLFSQKQQWDQLCQEIAEHFFPMRSDFTTTFTLGTDFAVDLMESYPVQARETLGNTIGALLRQGDWFAVKTGLEEIDEEPTNARWLEYATTHFRRLVYDRRANFVRATNEADHDWVAFGNPVLSVEESPDRSHFLFRDWHPKECAWMVNAVGKIDHNQRNMPMTARNMKMRKAWVANLHQDIIQAAEKDPTHEFKVRHIVLPFEEIYGDDKGKRRQYKNNPFCSIYIDCEHQTVLGEGPLPVFNYVIPRWRTVSSFPQAFSPATINALPDGRMLQSLARILLEQGEKAIDPPIYGRGEIFRELNRYAGGLTYVDLEADQKIQDSLMFESPAGGLSFGMEMKQDVRNLIAESFLLNKINLPPQQKTAFETQARLEEYRRAILPFTGPIESEYHLPLLDIGFQMAVRNDAFNIEDMPKALSEQDVTFTFEGPLNTAEGRQNVQAYQETLQMVSAGAQIDKTLTTLIDWKKATKDAVRGTQAPADWFNDEETQQDAEDAANQVDGLAQAAAALKGGADVGGSVADASLKLQQAGMIEQPRVAA